MKTNVPGCPGHPESDDKCKTRPQMRYRRRISPATHLIMGQDTGVMTGMFSSRPASCTFRLSEPNRTRFYRSPNVQSSRRSKAYHPLATRVKSLWNRTLIYRHMSEPTLIRRSDTDRLRFRTLRRVPTSGNIFRG